MARSHLQRVPSSQSSLRAFPGTETASFRRQPDTLPFKDERMEPRRGHVLHHRFGASAMMGDWLEELFLDPHDVSKVHMYGTKRAVVWRDLVHRDPEYNKVIIDLSEAFHAQQPIGLSGEVMLNEVMLSDNPKLHKWRLGFQAFQSLRLENALSGLDDSRLMPIVPPMKKPNYIYFEAPMRTMKSKNELLDQIDDMKNLVHKDVSKRLLTAVPLEITGFDVNLPPRPDDRSRYDMPLAS
jgi:hypothetical protein